MKEKITRPPVVETPARAAIRRIVEGVAAETHVVPDEIFSSRRDPATAKARQLAMRRLYDTGPEWSLKRVGRAFNRDHSTVAHALRIWPKGS